MKLNVIHNMSNIIVAIIIVLALFAMAAYAAVTVEITTETGLLTVGRGTVVSLSGSCTTSPDDSVTSYLWELIARPVGSTAELNNTDTRSTTFVPDLVGQYTVQLTVTTAQGVDTSVSVVITAATWVGVGNAGSATPQCTACHEDKQHDWANTPHAATFRNILESSGVMSYQIHCLKCHTMGYDTDSLAVNNGWDDIAIGYGWKPPVVGTYWTIPNPSSASCWDSLVINYPDLAALSSVQCENCHGPGSEHHGLTAHNEISSSYDEKVCNQCHHQYVQWEESAHSVPTSYPTGVGHEFCVKCHAGKAFVEVIETGNASSLEAQAFTCAVCHDPHDATNPAQLRTVADVTLANGVVITSGGTGKLCMRCHQAIHDVDTYVTEYHDHFGPHHSPQADMLAGSGGVEYGEHIENSAHTTCVSNACITCHMASTPADTLSGANKVGEHSFAMKWDYDTPENSSDDVENLNACTGSGCHSDLTTFNCPARDDYDGDSIVEGVQDEIQGLLNKLGTLLPPVGIPDVVVNPSYTSDQLKAAYNYFFVKNDGSFGIHNTNYAVQLLQRSYTILADVEPDENLERVPEVYSLSSNYPNPFSTEMKIKYSIPEEVFVTLKIYDIRGRLVKKLVDEVKRSGRYVVQWNGKNDTGRDMPSGVYFCTIRAGNFSCTNKIILVR